MVFVIANCLIWWFSQKKKEKNILIIYNSEVYKEMKPLSLPREVNLRKIVV